jgi:hypothetical protein
LPHQSASFLKRKGKVIASRRHRFEAYLDKVFDFSAKVGAEQQSVKHSLERSFASVVTIREVLRRGQHKFGLKESMRPNQTAKTPLKNPCACETLAASHQRITRRTSPWTTNQNAR